MIGNCACRWFEDNVFDNPIYWSCISVTKFIKWLVFTAVSRSLSRISCIVFWWSANKNLREIILSLKIFFFKMSTKSDDDANRSMYFPILQWFQLKTVSCSSESTWLWRSSSKEIENIQLHHEIDPTHLRSTETSSTGKLNLRIRSQEEAILHTISKR